MSSLSLSYSPLTSNYSMQGPILNIVSLVTELGAILASLLTPYTRVFSICSSADENARFYVSCSKPLGSMALSVTDSQMYKLLKTHKLDVENA